MIVGLDHVQVAAPPGCEVAARAFYGGLLGLREVAKPPALAGRGGVWFAEGLHVGVEAAASFAPARKAHPAFAVDPAALRPLAARLAAAGAPVEWDAAIDGRERCFTADPWGNRVELIAAAGPAARTGRG